MRNSLCFQQNQFTFFLTSRVFPPFFPIHSHFFLLTKTASFCLSYGEGGVGRSCTQTHTYTHPSSAQQTTLDSIQQLASWDERACFLHRAPRRRQLTSNNTSRPQSQSSLSSSFSSSSSSSSSSKNDSSTMMAVTSILSSFFLGSLSHETLTGE